MQIEKGDKNDNNAMFIQYIHAYDNNTYRKHNYFTNPLGFCQAPLPRMINNPWHSEIKPNSTSSLYDFIIACPYNDFFISMYHTVQV